MRTWADKGWMPCMTIVSRVTYMGSAMAATSSGWRHPLAGTGVSTCPFISLQQNVSVEFAAALLGRGCPAKQCTKQHLACPSSYCRQACRI